MRRTFLRLAVLAALLAAYPIGALVMSRVAPPGPGRPPDARLRIAQVNVTGEAVELHLRCDNLGTERVRVSRVTLLLLDAGDQPLVTVIEEGPAVWQRAGGEGWVEPGATRDLGRFRLRLPPGTHEPVVSAALTLLPRGARRAFTLQADREIAAHP